MTEPDSRPSSEQVPAAPTPQTEAERDGLDELEKMDQMLGFGDIGLDEDPLGIDPLDAAVAPPPTPAHLPPVWRPEAAEVEQADLAPSSLRTLEDLYARHTEIGSGEKFLQVYRKSPKMWVGVKVAGFLDDVHEQLGLREFSRRYGGGTYEVLVMGPGRNFEKDGQPAVRTLDKINIDIPGHPIINHTEEADMERRVMMPGMGRSPEVELEQIKMEREDRLRREQRQDRMNQMAMDNRGVDPSMLEQIEKQSSQRAIEVRDSMNATLLTLRSEIERLQKTLSLREEQLQETRQKRIEEQASAARELRDYESDRIRQIKVDSETSIKAVRDEAERETRRINELSTQGLKSMTDTYQVRISELNSRHDEQRKNYEQQATTERDRIRDESSGREQRAQADARERTQALRDNYEARITEIDRSNHREVDALKTQWDREVKSVERAGDGSAKLSRQSSDIQLQALRAELDRTLLDLESVRRTKEQLEQSLNKSPIEAIRDARELVEMTGGGNASPEVDWKQGFLEVVKTAVERAPDVAERFAQSRASNQDRRAAERRQQVMASAQRQQAMLAPPPQMSPPPLAQPQPPPHNYRPDELPGQSAPSWDMNNPLSPTPIASSEPVKPMSPVPSGSNEHAGGGLVPGFMATEPEPTPAPEPQAAEPAEPPPAPTSQSAADEQPQLSQITSEAIMEFAEKLSMAISSGLVTAEQFAEGFVSEVGIEASEQILTNITPEQLADGIAERGGENTPMVTREGRKYLDDLWVAALKIIADSKSAQISSPDPT